MIVAIDALISLILAYLFCTPEMPLPWLWATYFLAIEITFAILPHLPA